MNKKTEIRQFIKKVLLEIFDVNETKSPSEIMVFINKLHLKGYDKRRFEDEEWVYSFDNYKLQDVNLSDLKISAMHPPLYIDYSKMTSELPPIVVDSTSGYIIDGNHRAKAAEIRGDKTIKAYVGIRKTLRESFINESIFISKSEDFGSVEGVVHKDIERIKNWFLNRKIDYNKYINRIEVPVSFLNNINVDIEYRGKGYGDELYSYFEEECYDNDVKCILLESDNSENQVKGFNLDKWYESYDFEIIGNEGGNSIMIKYL